MPQKKVRFIDSKIPLSSSCTHQPMGPKKQSFRRSWGISASNVNRILLRYVVILKFWFGQQWRLFNDNRAWIAPRISSVVWILRVIPHTFQACVFWGWSNVIKQDWWRQSHHTQRFGAVEFNPCCGRVASEEIVYNIRHPHTYIHSKKSRRQQNNKATRMQEELTEPEGSRDTCLLFNMSDLLPGVAGVGCCDLNLPWTCKHVRCYGTDGAMTPKTLPMRLSKPSHESEETKGRKSSANKCTHPGAIMEFSQNGCYF